MDTYFDQIIPGRALSKASIDQLLISGFTTIPGPLSNDNLLDLAAAYDEVMEFGSWQNSGISNSLIRTHDFINRGPIFDVVYLHAPLIEACKVVINEPFKLSSFIGRTLKPQSAAQNLHADLPRASNAAPMVGFILMVDEFRSDNGATRFIPTSHIWPDEPSDRLADVGADSAEQVLACGPVGQMIIFNAAIWHGHTANRTFYPRRSIQGYFVRRNASPGLEFSNCIREETLARVAPLARYLLAI